MTMNDGYEDFVPLRKYEKLERHYYKLLKSLAKQDGEIERLKQEIGELKSLSEDVDPDLILATVAPPDGQVRGVYFVQSEDTYLINIGRSENLRHRVKQYNAATPGGARLVGWLRTTDYQTSEEGIHKRFALWRNNGEWFFPGPSLVAYIRSLKGGSSDN